MSLASSIMMLSSIKLTTLLLLLFATVFCQSAAFTLPAAEATTTAVAVDETTTPTSSPTTPTTTTTQKSKLPVMDCTPSQQKMEDYAKSVKIVFPSTNDSEEESKFDIYGLKVTPPPKGVTNKTVSNVEATQETTVIETTTSSTTSTVSAPGNSTDNVTPSSVDDRLGILNLAPHCPEGHVVVNQRCHKSA
ncbi:PREDICTED: integumentary mucin C.1-like [Rhagoletis zephyria]|uniref:integumentary mucin C.1-like n=1 Tax=Rhagoletis zephyria TaxID=28612 RepID=UPI0008119E42|nr:PREDICTED: integumentary mucin C.1-like [Rhagoletis zephyria]